MARRGFVCSVTNMERFECQRHVSLPPPQGAAIIRADPLLRGIQLPIGTAVHERTLPLCTSLNYREWSGFYAVSVYETHHEHEYNAIRNAAALIDVTPLFKYLITGPDATQASSTACWRATSTRSGSTRSFIAAGAMKTARSSTTAQSRGWKKTAIAGPPPIPTCGGCGRTRLASTSDRGHHRTTGSVSATGADIRPDC